MSIYEVNLYEVNLKIIIDANSIGEVGKAVDKIADMVNSDKVVVTNDINIRKVRGNEYERK